MVASYLTADLFLAVLLSVVVWLLISIYVTKLGLVAIEHSSIYSFMISIDLTMCYKRPVFLFGFSTTPIKDHASFRLCAIMLFATCALMLLGLWFDSRAEVHLRSVVSLTSQEKQIDVPAGFFGKLRYWFQRAFTWVSDTVQLRSWYAWRNLHAGLLLVLTTAHVYGLVSVTQFSQLVAP